MKKQFNEEPGEGGSTDQRFITIAGVKSFQASSYHNGIYSDYFIPKNDKTIRFNFEFNFDEKDMNLRNSYEKMIDQILSTFKFISTTTSTTTTTAKYTGVDPNALSRSCTTDSDCTLVDSSPESCWEGYCGDINYSDSKYIAVNRTAAAQYEPALFDYHSKYCGPAPLCPTNIKPAGAALCVNHLCEKGNDWLPAA